MNLPSSPSLKSNLKLPVNPYGKSKLIFEEILADYRKYAGLDYVSLRYFNVGGASPDRGECRRHETHLIPIVLNAVQAGHPHIQIFGTDYPTPDGTCIRDYIHVLDISDAHIRALENINRVSGSAFNVGTGIGHSIREVLDTVRLVTGSKIPEKTFPRRPGDPPALVADPGRAQTMLEWKAMRSLEQIVSSAWAWAQKPR